MMEFRLGAANIFTLVNVTPRAVKCAVSADHYSRDCYGRYTSVLITKYLICYT